MLITSDIEQRSEREMLASMADRLHADVLVIPHHGSRTSSSDAFVDQVNPDIAIATVGYRNRFGHPKEDVLDRYRALGSRIFRTDRDGALLLFFPGDGRVSIERYRAFYRRYWHSPVDETELADDPAL
jgi:competence protein ComEC